MKPFLLEFNYNDRPHLYQIYTGLSKLAEKNVVELKVHTKINTRPKHSILEIKVNKTKNIVFDTLDGFNWIDGTIEENLEYFQKTFFNVDYYFKRSYNDLLKKYSPENCQVLPLGLNYLVYPSIPIVDSDLKEKAKHYIKNNKISKKFLSFKTDEYKSEIFEFYPIIGQSIKILFLTRLWNPDDVKSDSLKYDRDKINKCRVRYINICREEFGDIFTGGITDDEFSRSYAPEFLIPQNISKKTNFLNLLKDHQICIATTGLHNSIGWKFGEYVAASRGIISEPLHYTIPGNFRKPSNYLEFSNDMNLINNIYYLLQNKEHLQQMMLNNLHYYNNFLKPENLIFNSLMEINSSKQNSNNFIKSKVS